MSWTLFAQLLTLLLVADLVISSSVSAVLRQRAHIQLELARKLTELAERHEES